MSDLDFVKFFSDVHGIDPLPWQTRLVRKLIERQPWPDLIDLPTATGKTACIDIALFHLAWCASLHEPWLAARRIAFVVDRRIIVDSAFERAEKIRKALKEPKTPAITAVANALSTQGTDEPLCCQKLRGGMPRERGFALHPAQPMVITSTVDQIGSRLLFRGYGLRSYTQPVHAGLLGHDTLILLDEAHLADPFVQTVAAIRREQRRAEQPLHPIQPVRLVRLSATARTAGVRFQLDQDDLNHPELGKRLTTPKLARLVEAPNGPADRLKILMQETLDVYQKVGVPAPAVAVMVNRVRTARELATRLQAVPNTDYQVKLVTGRCRPLDRDILSDWLIARVRSGRRPSSADKGLIVVATQSLEVGADLDFQGLVTECASLPALRQRFGRLDRLGDFRRASAVIIGGGEQSDDPVYGSSLCRTWDELKGMAQRSESSGGVDFSVTAMERALATADIAAMIETPRDALQLTPSHVELLCQTSPRPMYDPDVSALLHGFQSQRSEIQVVWRSDIPAKKSGQHWVIDREDKGLVTALLSVIPPTTLEALSLPRNVLCAWLATGTLSPTLSDVEGAALDEEVSQPRRNGCAREVWRRVNDGWEAVEATSLRPGETIVLPNVYGGCDEFGFSPESHGPVADLSQLARERLKRECVIVLTPQTLEQRLGSERHDEIVTAWKTVCEAHSSEQASADELWAMLGSTLGQNTIDMLRIPPKPKVELFARDSGLYSLILRDNKPGLDDFSDEDLSSSRTTPILLDEHNAGVGKRARELAEAVKLNNHVETLGCAGDTHDLGKADPRFQRVLRSGDYTTLAEKLLAKGLRRVCSARNELGERHEAYSVAVLKSHPELLDNVPDSELALYLVGVHHGRGRAQMPFSPDDGARFTVSAKGRMVEFEGVPNLAILGSGWPALFWRLNERYGPWGLAYLEALLRLADALQSQYELQRGSVDG
jgi:CRISPR-associated endonuclease/helicase Cas3